MRSAWGEARRGHAGVTTVRAFAERRAWRAEGRRAFLARGGPPALPGAEQPARLARQLARVGSAWLVVSTRVCW